MARRRVGRVRARTDEAAANAPAPAFDLRRFAPSASALLTGFALVAAAIGSYGVARETSLFAIERIEILGAQPGVRSSVHEALEPLVGRSLVGLRPAELDRRVATLPDVVGVTHDRAFPHTLRVHVLPERPLLVLRRGKESWLVSARARVVRPLVRGARPGFARVWVPRGVAVAAGDTLADPTARRAVRVAGLAARHLPRRVRAVKIDGAETTLILRSGLQVRLGRAYDLDAKLAVAAQILPRIGPEATYVDVAVPDRPVVDGYTHAQAES